MQQARSLQASLCLCASPHAVVVVLAYAVLVRSWSCPCLQAENKSIILFAVNDNPFVSEANGGSHWTLLSFTRRDNTYRHYDSAGGSGNQATAKTIARKLRPLLRWGLYMCIEGRLWAFATECIRDALVSCWS